MNKFLLLYILPLLLLMACGGESQSTATQDAPPAEAAPEAADPAAMWDGDIAEAQISEAGTPLTSPDDATALTLDAAASQAYWRGAKVAYDHIGTLNLASGTLHMAGGQLVGGTVSMDMTSIVDLDIDDPKKNADLVGHLKSPDFFDVDNHPTATLDLTSITPAEGNTYTVSGNLTIKGITHQITFPAEIVMGADGISAQARFSFDRSKWDVRFGSGSFFEDLGDKLILDQVGLILDLKAS